MIKSMTGFGKALAELPGRNISVEIKTLNSKQLDLNLKLPGFLREKEWEIRSLITQHLVRGKVDLFLGTEATGDSAAVTINRGLARRYYNELKELAGEFQETPGADILSLVLRMPEVMQTGREDPDENDWGAIYGAILKAIAQADQFRMEEGRVLEEDMTCRVNAIVTLLKDIEPFEKQRIHHLRERLAKEFAKLAAELTSASPDQNRFEQEIIYYLEKLDITEEKVRLQKHCRYFLETLAESESQGKKLGFVVQEMGREINTIGSKASDAEIQKIVVMMKDELEKVKEQLGNIL